MTPEQRESILKEKLKVGDKVRGSWRDEATGQTYFQEGVIVEYPATGLWVQSQPDGGITPLKSFFFINKDQRFHFPDAETTLKLDQ